METNGRPVTKIAAILFLLIFLPAGLARTQQPPEDPIAQNLFPPELIMKHQQDIGLDGAQGRAIREAIQKAQARFTDAQWDMQSESTKLVRLLQAHPVEEAGVLAQVDKVLSLEREVKRAQLSLLIRIKNVLSESQQAKLMELRKR